MRGWRGLGDFGSTAMGVAFAVCFAALLAGFFVEVGVVASVGTIRSV